jgi:hypothetical protein
MRFLTLMIAVLAPSYAAVFGDDATVAQLDAAHR